MHKKPVFPRELSAPIEVTLPEDSDNMNWEQIESQVSTDIERQRTVKFSLLLNHYNIDPSDPHFKDDLIFKLISDFFSGFSIKPYTSNSGRKTVWSDSKLMLLWVAVEELIKGRSGKAKEKCRYLSKQEPWKGLLAVARGQGTTSKTKEATPDMTLYNRYLESKKLLMLNIMKAIVEIEVKATSCDKEKRMSEFRSEIRKQAEELERQNSNSQLHMRIPPPQKKQPRK